MYVRTTTVTGATDIDQGVAFVRDEVEPELSRQAGFRGISMSGDRSSGQVVVLSQWETRADLDASESAADKARADAMGVLGGQQQVERYEQLMWETFGTGPHPGAQLFIRGLQVDPERVDEQAEFFREVVLPEIRTAPGVLGVRLMANRDTGQCRVGTIWTDREARDGFMAGMAERQARAESRGVRFTGDVSLEVLYAAMR